MYGFAVFDASYPAGAPGDMMLLKLLLASVSVVFPSAGIIVRTMQTVKRTDNIRFFIFLSLLLSLIRFPAKEYDKANLPQS